MLHYIFIILINLTLDEHLLDFINNISSINTLKFIFQVKIINFMEIKLNFGL